MMPSLKLLSGILAIAAFLQFKSAHGMNMLKDIQNPQYWVDQVVSGKLDGTQVDFHVLDKANDGSNLYYDMVITLTPPNLGLELKVNIELKAQACDVRNMVITTSLGLQFTDKNTQRLMCFFQKKKDCEIQLKSWVFDVAKEAEKLDPYNMVNEDKNTITISLRQLASEDNDVTSLVPAINGGQTVKTGMTLIDQILGLVNTATKNAKPLQFKATDILDATGTDLNITFANIEPMFGGMNFSLFLNGYALDAEKATLGCKSSSSDNCQVFTLLSKIIRPTTSQNLNAFVVDNLDVGAWLTKNLNGVSTDSWLHGSTFTVGSISSACQKTSDPFTLTLDDISNSLGVDLKDMTKNIDGHKALIDKIQDALLQKMDDCLPEGTKLNKDRLKITDLKWLNANLTETFSKENILSVTGDMLAGAGKNPAGLLKCIDAAKSITVGDSKIALKNLNISLSKSECDLAIMKTLSNLGKQVEKEYDPCAIHNQSAPVTGAPGNSQGGPDNVNKGISSDTQSSNKGKDVSGAPESYVPEDKSYGLFQKKVDVKGETIAIVVVAAVAGVALIAIIVFLVRRRVRSKKRMRLDNAGDNGEMDVLYDFGEEETEPVSNKQVVPVHGTSQYDSRTSTSRITKGEMTIEVHETEAHNIAL